jgi:hypothetical protein
MAWGNANNVDIQLYTRTGSNITEMRESMAREIVRMKDKQFDKIFWIDSDISWTVSDFLKILMSPFQITCGAYMITPRGHLSVARVGEDDSFQPYNIDEEFELFYTVDEMESMGEYVPIIATGFGFVCMDDGIFEAIGDSWFVGIDVDFEVDGVRSKYQCSSEDTSFCVRARRAGFKLMYDTTVLVGHEKPTLWLPSISRGTNFHDNSVPNKRWTNQWHKWEGPDTKDEPEIRWGEP